MSGYDLDVATSEIATAVMGGFASDFGHVVDPIYQVLRINVSVYVPLMQDVSTVIRVLHPVAS